MTGTPLGHDEAHERLAELALDTLDAADRARLVAHVAQCPACSAELDEWRAATAAMALSASSSRDSTERASAVRGRLLARAKASKEATLAPPRSVSRGWSPMNRMAVSAAAVAVASVALNAFFLRDRTQLRDELASLGRRAAAMAHASDSLHVVVAGRDSIIASLTGRDMSLVRLTSSATHEAWALMFWNRTTNAWTFVAHNLPQPAAGRTYQLWLVTAGAKISAGTFAPGVNGEAVVRAVYALGRDALKAVAVTDEPAGGVPQPTGPFVVIGADAGTR